MVVIAPGAWSQLCQEKTEHSFDLASWEGLQGPCREGRYPHLSFIAVSILPPFSQP